MVQLASTSFTVTEKEGPAGPAEGEPVFPVVEPGTAVSPGTRSCSFVAVPGLTVIDGEVSLGSGLPPVSVAVIVQSAAARLSCTENVFVPETSAASPGRVE